MSFDGVYAGGHINPKEIEDRILNELFAVLREVCGGVLADTDHDHALRQNSTITVCAGGYLRYRRIGELRDGRCQRKDALGIRPSRDSSDGIGIEGREEGQLSVCDGQSSEKRVSGLGN